MRGRDIKRNGYEWAKLYCICTFPAAHIDIKNYPSIEKWFKDASWSDEVPSGAGQLKLEQTGTKHSLNGMSFKSRKKTGNKWFETQDQIAYKDDFDKQKIIYPETTQSARFYYDREGFMVEKTCFIMTGNFLKYISSSLSSKIFEFAYKRLFSSIELGEKGYQYNKHALEKLPIAMTDFDESVSELEIKKIYHLTDDEMNFISSSLKSNTE